MKPDHIRAQDAAYAEAVADARYLLRRAFRLIDEEARKVGLGALEHQLIVQLRGAASLTYSVSDLAVRLDVQLNLVSRIATELEKRNLVVRERSASDGRVTLVRATPEAVNLARRVAERIRPHFDNLQAEFSLERRKRALEIWAQNFGIPVVIPEEEGMHKHARRK